MASKEAIFKAIKFEKTERIPVTLFGAGAWTIHHSGNKFLNLVNEPEKNGQNNHLHQ
jgi:hypothetical protein